MTSADNDSDDDARTDSTAPALSASAPRKRRKARKAQPKALRVNLENCKYEVVRLALRELGWKEVGDTDTWDVYWTDTSVGTDRVCRLASNQRMNHFSGMLELCRKKSMARHLDALATSLPRCYKFSPATFLLPEQLDAFRAELKGGGKGKQKGSKKAWIVKPDSGSQGRGITLVQTAKQGEQAAAELAGEAAVAQRYLARPLLLRGGLKFDLRVYALVSSASPLRVYVYREGLARFCTVPYAAPEAGNLATACMHLTNYAINRHSAAFVRAGGGDGGGGRGGDRGGDSVGGHGGEAAGCGDRGCGGRGDSEGDGGEQESKWSLTALLAALRDAGHDPKAVWRELCACIVKSLLAVQPLLAHAYAHAQAPSATPRAGGRAPPATTADAGSRCFELLGYDFMLDSNAKPWLIEVNHSPSFNIDSPLDRDVKRALIVDTLRLVRVSPAALRRSRQAEKKAAQQRLVTRRSRATAGSADSSGAASPATTCATNRVAPAADAAAGSPTVAPDLSRVSSQATSGSLDTSTSAAASTTPAGLTAAPSAASRKRAAFELANVGNYERAYPPAIDTAEGRQRAVEYDECAAAAAAAFEQHHAKRMRNHLDSIVAKRRLEHEAAAVQEAAEEEARARFRSHQQRQRLQHAEVAALRARERDAALATVLNADAGNLGEGGKAWWDTEWEGRLSPEQQCALRLSVEERSNESSGALLADTQPAAQSCAAGTAGAGGVQASLEAGRALRAQAASRCAARQPRSSCVIGGIPCGVPASLVPPSPLRAAAVLARSRSLQARPLDHRSAFARQLSFPVACARTPSMPPQRGAAILGGTAPQQKLQMLSLPPRGEPPYQPTMCATATEAAARLSAPPGFGNRTGVCHGAYHATQTFACESAIGGAVAAAQRFGTGAHLSRLAALGQAGEFDSGWKGRARESGAQAGRFVSAGAAALSRADLVRLPGSQAVRTPHCRT